MTAIDDLAKAIITVTSPRAAFPPVGLVEGTVTGCRYLATGVSELDVMGVTDGVLSIPVTSWMSAFKADVAVNPAAITGRRVLILVSSSRAVIMGLVG